MGGDRKKRLPLAKRKKKKMNKKASDKCEESESVFGNTYGRT